MNDPFTSFDYKLLLNSMKPREFQRAYNLMKSMATSFKGKTHPFFSVCFFSLHYSFIIFSPLK